MVYTVPYEETLTFELPKGMTGTLVESKRVPPIKDVEKAMAEALAEPISSPRLPHRPERTELLEISVNRSP